MYRICVGVEVCFSKMVHLIVFFKQEFHFFVTIASVAVTLRIITSIMNIVSQ